MTTIGSTAYFGASYRYGAYEKSPSVAEVGNGDNPGNKRGLEADSDPSGLNDDSSTAIDTRTSAALGELYEKLSRSELNILDKSSTLASGNAWELPNEQYQRIVEGIEGALRANYTEFPEFPDLSDYPATQAYATILVGGEIVATIDNQGVFTTSDRISNRIQGTLLDSLNGTNGPDLARARADQLAKLLGGTTSIADSAITQPEFEALPPLENLLKPTIDFDAMRNDPLYQSLQDLKSKRGEFLASL